MNDREIQSLYKEFHTPMHVRQHCLQVGRVGNYLAKALNQAGEIVDSEIVRKGGLVHDFIRIVDFTEVAEDLGTKEDQEVWRKLREQYKGRHHGEVGAEILRARGEKKLAEVVERHITSLIITSEGPNTWESKLVFYADKRVAHDTIVSLEERLREGWIRYTQGREKTPQEIKVEQAIYALEKEIFTPLTLTPEDVMEALGKTIQ